MKYYVPLTFRQIQLYNESRMTYFAYISLYQISFNVEKEAIINFFFIA